MKRLAAAFAAQMLLVVVVFCGFGFLATFEPTDNALAFRVGYVVIGIGCLAAAILLTANAVRNGALTCPST